MVLLPARLPAPDLGAAELPGELGAVQLARRTGTWCSRRPASAPSNTTQLDSIYSSLEKDFLQQQPEIPLWYNGIWFQGNTQYWTNYPSSTSSDQNIPAMWAGYMGAMTTVIGLAQLTQAKTTS